MTEDPTASARDWVEAFNEGDWARLRSLLALHAVYEEPGTGRRLEGADAILELYRIWRTAFPDLRVTIDAAIADRGVVALEIGWTGTHGGALPGPDGALAPTGRRVDVRAVQVLRIRGGKLVEAHHYFDVLGLLEQLGEPSYAS